MTYSGVRTVRALILEILLRMVLRGRYTVTVVAA